MVKHFDDFQEDQFDFHAYCVRKMTLRAYVQMLRMEDSIYQNIFYSKVGEPVLFIAGHLVAPSPFPRRAVSLHKVTIPAPACDLPQQLWQCSQPGFLSGPEDMALVISVLAKMPVKISFGGLPTLSCRAVLKTQTGSLDQCRTARCSKLVCGVQAAWAAIQVYLELHQKPTNLNHGHDDLANSNLSPEDLKKLKLKRKKVTCCSFPDAVRTATRLQAHQVSRHNLQSTS